MRRACAIALGIAALNAHAERDSFGVGDGHDGPLSANANTIVNQYSALTADAPAGSRTLSLAAPTDFGAGRLLMLLTMTSSLPVPDSGTPMALIDLSSDDVGAFELARVLTQSGNQLTLTAPLVRGVQMGRTQAVTVPEYSAVSFLPGSIVATPWNGSVGGVLAFLVNGTLDFSGGLIDASAIGYRGGAAVDSPDAGSACAVFDEAAPYGGAKGESFGARAATGRGEVLTGGGGGVCRWSGGGGGALAGRGGQGGDDSANRPVGGLGGRAVFFSPLDRLLLGGGGGAGHTLRNNLSSGRPGGGIVFIRASSSSSGSPIRVSGGTGTPGDWDVGAAGGGGAGGTLYLRVGGPFGCQSADLFGGTGGGMLTGNPSAAGPGGGGGGGRALLQYGAGTCPIDVRGGSSGQVPGGSSRGSLPGQPGAATVLMRPFPVLPPPTIDAPPAGAEVPATFTVSGRADAGQVMLVVDDGADLPVPVLDGGFWSTELSAVSAGPHRLSAHAYVDAVYSVATVQQVIVDAGTSVVVVITHPGEADTVTGTPTFEGIAPPDANVLVRVDGVEVAAAHTTADGGWVATVPPVHRLAAGDHTAVATARFEDSAPVRFRVDDSYKAGCSCGASEGLLLVSCSVVALRARRRRANPKHS